MNMRAPVVPVSAAAGRRLNVNVGGQSAIRTMSADEMREMFGNGDPFSDFFHTFFGGNAGTDESGPRPPAAVVPAGRDVSRDSAGLEDAYGAWTRRLAGLTATSAR
jgi:hypothetical protein